MADIQVELPGGDTVQVEIRSGGVIPVEILGSGPPGARGEQGPVGPKGEPGETGPAGPGVPAGGTAGQILRKSSGTDYDTGWEDEAVSREELRGIYPVDTASGPVASFPDGAGGLPLKSLTVNIDPVQSGTGTPAPDNVRPITGWTGVTVSHSDEDTSSPETLSISWQEEAGTVYGGSLDVLTGVLTVTKRYLLLNDKDAWESTTGSIDYRLNYQIQRKLYSDSYSGLMCTYAPAKSSAAGVLYARWSGAQSGYFGFKEHGSGITLDDIRTASENGEIAICYDLKENDFQTFQLTPQEVTTLLGVNNIWADTGDSAAEYRADIRLYIQKLTGSAEEDMTANANIANGKYFMVGNSLYLSTQSIAAGQAIVPGTNCAPTNLAAALNALNS